MIKEIIFTVLIIGLPSFIAFCILTHRVRWLEIGFFAVLVLIVVWLMIGGLWHIWT